MQIVELEKISSFVVSEIFEIIAKYRDIFWAKSFFF